MKHCKSILGVHFDDNFLNMVHLKQTPSALQLCNWKTEPLDEALVQDGMVLDTETIAKKIQKFLKAGRQKVHKVVILLSCSAVRLTSSEFPLQSTEQLKQQIEEQIAGYNLFDNEEIVFDYCLFEKLTGTQKSQTVLEAVTSRSVSDACLAIARQAGLDLTAVEPAILPIMNLNFNELSTEPDTVSLLLALGSTSGNLLVFKDCLPRFCRSLNTGTKNISCDDDNIASLLSEMKPVLGFAGSLSDCKPGPVILRVAANCSNEKLKFIIEKLEQHLPDLVVSDVNCHEIKSRFDIEETGTNNDLPIFAFAGALTTLCQSEFTHRINLVSHRSLDMQKTQKQISFLAKAFAAIVILSIASIQPFRTKASVVIDETASIQAAIKKTEALKQKLTELTAWNKKLNQELSAYIDAGRDLVDIPWSQVLRTIGNVRPKKVRIVNIATIEPPDFIITGEALNESDIYRFAKELQNTNIIESAEAEELKYDNSNSYVMVNYRIICKLHLSKAQL